jgi:type I restriction-modification system DNA methylase subunit
MINIRKLEAELWESADLLRQGSKLTSSQYCMPVLALLFLRYAYSRYKMVEAERLEEVIKTGEKEFSTRFTAILEEEKKQAKEAIASATRKEKKQVEAEWKETIEHWEDLVETARQFEWLTEKFGDGEYRDILGLCKIATIQEIAEKNYSLTPGAYVGVAEQEDDGVDFHERMNEIHAELAQLNQEANVLMDEIQKAWEGLK